MFTVKQKKKAENPHILEDGISKCLFLCLNNNLKKIVADYFSGIRQNTYT